MTTQPSTPPRIVATVLTFNNELDTSECLTALENMNPACTEILLVDNGSTDGSIDRLMVRHPGVRAVRLERNVGFTGGANRALDEAIRRHADFVLFLANDTVPAPDMLAPLCHTAADEHVGVVGPRVVEYDRPTTLQHGAGFIDSASGRMRVSDPATTCECDWVTGCGFLLRVDALRAMHAPRGFDEQFFLYWEDTDFCRRIVQAGFRVMYAPDARLRHKESSRTRERMSTAKRRSRRYYMLRNQFLFARRHLGARARARLTARMLLLDLPRELARVARYHRASAVPEMALVLRAHTDGLLGRTGRATYAGLY